MVASTAVDDRNAGEAELAARIAAGDREAAHQLVRRNNQRLFRAAWSIVKDRAEAEEVVQEAYLRAFAGIGGFRGGASLSTWVTRIVVNEAISRARAAHRREQALEGEGVVLLRAYRQRTPAAPSLGEAPDEPRPRSAPCWRSRPARPIGPRRRL